MMTDQSIISQVRDEGYRAGYEQASMLTHDDAYIKGFDDATRQADGLAFMADAIHGLAPQFREVGGEYPRQLGKLGLVAVVAGNHHLAVQVRPC